MLTRFWIRFQGTATETWPCTLGCGVTAIDVAEAMALVETHVFQASGLPPVESVEENIDVSTLDPKHILPNIGLPYNRGVWFPNRQF